MDLKVEYVSIKDLIPTEGNPRVHTTEHIVNISKSIRKFGFINPILVDKATNNIIAGHGRYLAAVSLNMDTVPVIFLPDLTPAQVRELIVADNAITDQSKWDLSLLSHMLSGLDDLGYLELPTIDAVASVEMPELPDGEKEPFQQMTFTLADEQAEFIKAALNQMKGSDAYNAIETFGNENSNGNALYALVKAAYNVAG